MSSKTSKKEANKSVTEQAAPKQQLSHYTLSVEDSTELVEVINGVVGNKYGKKVIFDAINNLIKPVMVPVQENKSEKA